MFPFEEVITYGMKVTGRVPRATAAQTKMLPQRRVTGWKMKPSSKAEHIRCNEITMKGQERRKDKWGMQSVWSSWRSNTRESEKQSTEVYVERMECFILKLNTSTVFQKGWWTEGRRQLSAENSPEYSKVSKEALWTLINFKSLRWCTSR